MKQVNNWHGVILEKLGINIMFVQKIIFCGLMMLFAGCATTANTTTYMKTDDVEQNLARIVVEKKSFLGFAQWVAKIGDIIDTEGVSVVDAEPPTNSQWQSRKSYDSVSLSAGKYKVTLDCNYSDGASSAWGYAVTVLDIEPQKEYVLGCHKFKSDEKNLLGFKKRKLRAELLSVHSLNLDDQSKEEVSSGNN